MLKKIIIKNIATYDSIGQEIGELKKVNFFYGSNGSGKTTLSRIIANEKNYSDCFTTRQTNTPIKTLVYNQDFVELNFNEDSELKGIFTLGKDEKDKKDEIFLKKQNLSNLEQKIEDKRKYLGDFRNEQEKNNNLLKEKCWSVKKKYEKEFKSFFDGFNNDKEKFKHKCLEMAKQNNSDLLSFSELIKKANKIFHGTTNKIPTIYNVDFSILSSFETNHILETKIIGKRDVNIAALIEKLNNSDWLKLGYRYLENSNDICPFCQQAIVIDKLKNQLDEYFDETYQQQINSLKIFAKSYDEYIANKLIEIEKVLNNKINKIDWERINNIKLLMESKLSSNLDRLNRKIDEPSLIIKLDTLTEQVKEFESIVCDFNKYAIEQNKFIDSLKLETETLKGQFWQFIGNELKNDISQYNGEDTRLKKIIRDTDIALKNYSSKLTLQRGELSILEQETTSVRPTVDAINKILKNFGFTSFKLAENGSSNYLIVRHDNKIVAKTLSEGEKTFITFLYFYHLVKGANINNSITENRIVVFDDPISSLDSDVLFMVSSLIREIISEVRNKKSSPIKQVFVMTHNTYFHKEITYHKKAQKNEDTFWIVRKENNVSKIKSYSTNPIRTSYEFLWQEVKEPNPTTIQNTLRRILENYFNFQGKNLHDLVDKFEDEDKSIYRSLISWMHDGSHNILDDFHSDNNQDLIERYLSVFEKIFSETNHAEHYKMMMDED